MSLHGSAKSADFFTIRNQRNSLTSTLHNGRTKTTTLVPNKLKPSSKIQINSQIVVNPYACLIVTLIKLLMFELDLTLSLQHYMPDESGILS